nr:retrovirus-related Pol polyprotein from transposon TNT 1-94 [Tanacetum cinerariifolium]
MTLETHNWSSSAHQELHKIVKDEIFPIVNQVDARVQNFEIHFLKETAKFIGDFKSLAKEADEALAKHKALELEFERLLKAVVISTPQESKGVNHDKVIAPGIFKINPFKTSREEKHVPNSVRASARTKPITVSQPPVFTKKHKANVSIKEKQKKHQPHVKKPKKVGFLGRLATPKPRKPRFLLRWSPTGRLFDQKGKIVDFSESKSQSDCSNGDNACCSKHITGNLKLLINFVWKFMGTVRFGNDHVAIILGFGDLQWGNILITRVYFVEGLGHNLFSVGQFCDSDLEVAFRRNACFVRNLDGVDLKKQQSISSTKTSSKFKAEITSSSYGFVWSNGIASVIMDDYSRYTWVHFLRSKDEAPEVIKTFLKRITVLLQSHVIIIRTDNGTEFKNQALKDYFDSVVISHQMSSVRTPQQNGVVERRNRTLVEAARTMLIFSHAPLFLWAEVIATACFTQNRSIIHPTARTVPPAQEPQAKPTEKHLKEVKRIFHYLWRTVNTGLWYSKDSSFELTGFSDADYAGCKDTFKSTFGGAQFSGEKLVSWSSKKQDCTALSTVEAEYVSLSSCCAQVLRMRTQLTDYGFHFNKIPIY